MLLPDIHLYSLFLMKLHPFTLLLLIYFALNSSVSGIGFSFFKKGVYLIGFFFFFFKESIDFGTSRKINTVQKTRELTKSILIGKTMHFPCGNKIYHKMGI